MFALTSEYEYVSCAFLLQQKHSQISSTQFITIHSYRLYVPIKYTIKPNDSWKIGLLAQQN